jgi:PTS system mannitol-specific IIC component
MAVTPPGNHFGVLLGILLSAAVSFVVSWFLLRLSKSDEGEADLAAAQAKSKEMKG